MESMESQNTEWKATWRDEYLKWVCAFANVQGGVIEIGKDNKGRVVGIADAERLLQDLPNKIRNAMGIIADVDLVRKNGLATIRISVKPHPFPISYHGKYYYRSGSTTQELSGYALDEFMLKKQGKTWDGVPIPHVSVKNLDKTAIREFREKALISKRLSAADLRMSDAKLIDNLMLTEGSYLNRAAVLLFHPNPEKWVLGASVKIGYFENDADLMYQDEISGPLMLMPDRVLDLIYTKYFKGIISYQGIQRVETFPVARDALREAVLNAIVHRDYSTGNSIHIKIYDDKVLIFNDGRLPDNWTAEKLLKTHTSKPYNPFIAKTFFRSGMIETWGRGIERIVLACEKEGNAPPYFEVNSSDLMIGFYTASSSTNSGITGGVNGEITADDNKLSRESGGESVGINFGINFGINATQEKIVLLMHTSPNITAPKIANELGISVRQVEANIRALKKLGLIERIGANRNGQWLVHHSTT
jgi:ATP-dependent DNA helicase RecG